MQFTSRELRLTERLRKQERQWPRLRWVALAAGLLCTVAAALYGRSLFFLASGLNSNEPTSPDTVLAIAIFFGNANRTLLLRLLDSEKSTTNDKGAV